MKTKNLLIIGAVAVGAYLLYRRMNKTNENTSDNEVKTTPVNNTQPAFGKPVKMNNCPTREQLASRRYTKEQMDELKAMGCI